MGYRVTSFRSSLGPGASEESEAENVDLMLNLSNLYQNKYPECYNSRRWIIVSVVDAATPLFSTYVCKVKTLLHGTMVNSHWYNLAC
jgi:hypothetical protein